MTEYVLGYSVKALTLVDPSKNFAMDEKTGLWRDKAAMEMERGYLGFSLGTWTGVWAGNSHQAEAPKPPATATALWDNPEAQSIEIVAFRGWDFELTLDEEGQFGVELHSPSQDFVWDGPVANTEAPTQNKHHGFYAIGRAAHCEGNFNSYVGGNPIWGRVALSGVVAEGATGFRAERVAIQELWVNASRFNNDDGDEDPTLVSPQGLCRHLADKYQCDASVKTPRWRDLLRGKYDAPASA